MSNFEVGKIVYHRRYHYRGVVIARDVVCQASKAWYENNRTQPTRTQPWYRVLVDDGRETYVAQENLDISTDLSPINHPLVDKFFPTYLDGRYYLDSLN